MHLDYRDDLVEKTDYDYVMDKMFYPDEYDYVESPRPINTRLLAHTVAFYETAKIFTDNKIMEDLNDTLSTDRQGFNWDLETIFIVLTNDRTIIIKSRSIS